MDDIQLEGWALRVVEAITSGSHPEDARVELKAEWPADLPRTARQLGGHANAARRQAILWLIGVDEKRGPVQHEAQDTATWWPQVSAFFEGVPPRLERDLIVFFQEQPFRALLFETSRAPYVVKRASQGDDRLEVPWREGSRTRSARRDELVSLLTSAKLSPELSILNAQLWADTDDQGATWRWYARVYLFVVPRSDGMVVVREEGFTACIVAGGEDVLLSEASLLAASRDRADPAGHPVTVAHGQVTFRGPGAVPINFSRSDVSSGVDPRRLADIDLSVTATAVGAAPETVELRITTAPEEHEFSKKKLNLKWHV